MSNNKPAYYYVGGVDMVQTFKSQNSVITEQSDLNNQEMKETINLKGTERSIV